MKRDNIPDLFNYIKFTILIALILLELFIFYFMLTYLDAIVARYYIIFQIIGLLVIFKILSSSKKYVYKLSWTVFLVILPLPALVFYILFGDLRFIKKLAKREAEIIKELDYVEKQNMKVVKAINNPDTLSEVDSIYGMSSYKVYSDSETKYFPLGEDFFKDIIKELKEAKEFILIEFYILAHGELYDEIKEILIDKAKNGVEIYIQYDKLGSTGRFFEKDEVELRQYNIKIVAFNNNPLDMFKFLNYRSHRKIVVIDGKYAYTGGINLADEYINTVVKYGHWKDMGIRISGESTYAFTKAFFKNWILTTKDEINIKKFKGITNKQEFVSGTSTVVPFTDGPTNPQEVGQHNYMKIIANAKDYVYITTPYLIIDEEMAAVLKLCATSGVDVRILVPGIPDKKLVYEVTKSHFRDLINAGVQIYTYTEGFVHGKTIMSDDRVATVGSINFDFRSLLWNYECAVYVADEEFVNCIKSDFLDSINKSKNINKEFSKHSSFKENYVYGAIRLIGPLL